MNKKEEERRRRHTIFNVDHFCYVAVLLYIYFFLPVYYNGGGCSMANLIYSISTKLCLKESCIC